MIVALLNQKGGVGKTTLALHLAGEWARQGRRVTLIDADPRVRRWTGRNSAPGKVCRGCSVRSGLPGTRCTGKPPSWP